MIRLIVLGLDGLLVSNSVFSYFEKGFLLWLIRIPLLGKMIFKIIEFIEWLIGFNYEKNQPLIDFISELKKSEKSIKFFVITNRSAFGLKRAWRRFSGLEFDYLQIRGAKKERIKKEGIKGLFGIKEEIFVSSLLKPRADSLLCLALLLKKKKINNSEVLVVDVGENFLNIAKAFPYVFKTPRSCLEEIYKKFENFL